MMPVLIEMEKSGGCGFTGKRSLLTNIEWQDSQQACPKSSWSTTRRLAISAGVIARAGVYDFHGRNILRDRMSQEPALGNYPVSSREH